jgi:hypothetical protein
LAGTACSAASKSRSKSGLNESLNEAGPAVRHGWPCFFVLLAVRRSSRPHQALTTSAPLSAKASATLGLARFLIKLAHANFFLDAASLD